MSAAEHSGTSAAEGDALELPYRVRFDESTPAGTVRTSALVRYAQDCAWAHSERLGFGRDWYARRGLFWLVRAMELRLTGTLATGAVASVTTRVIGFRHVLARRLTTVAGPDGSTVASIDTDWAMVMDDGMPTRIPDEFRALLGARSTPFRPHRVSLPPSPDGAAAAADRPGPVRLAFRVRPQELDPMAHANNAAYVDWLEEALATDARSGIAGEHGATAPANGAEADRRPVDPGGLSDLLRQVPRTYRLEYLLPARPNVELTAEAWRSGGSAAAAYRLSDPAGDLLHATVEA